MSTFAAVTFSRQHLLHPLTLPAPHRGTLSWKERAVAITVLAAGILLAVAYHPLFLGAGVIGFYLVCGYLKARKIQQLPANTPPPAPLSPPPPPPQAGPKLPVPPPAKPNPVNLQIKQKSPPVHPDQLRAQLGDVEYAEKWPSISLRHRYQVRDETKQKMSEFFDDFKTWHNDFEICFNHSVDQLIDSSWVRDPQRVYLPHLPKVQLFSSPDSATTFNKNQLLGRYDVLATPCRMDYDAEWKPHTKPQTPFYVHHAGALNIGESSKAEDFSDYATKRKLDENKYVADMGKIVGNMLRVQQASGAEEAVWFPFGMGAFMRHLPKNDPTYADPEMMWQLKEKLAQEMVRQFQASPLNIHLCMPMRLEIGADPREQAVFDEMNQNYNAFVAALTEAKPKNVKLHVNGDATAIAQTLANSKGEYKVSLANGANRHLIGNHWAYDRAEYAIDENLTRRSSLLAVIALIVNCGSKNTKDKNTLADAVKRLQQVKV